MLMMNRGEDSSSDVISMVETTKPRQGNDLRIHRWLFCGEAFTRGLLIQAKMCSVVVVVADVLVSDGAH